MSHNSQDYGTAANSGIIGKSSKKDNYTLS